MNVALSSRQTAVGSRRAPGWPEILLGALAYAVGIVIVAFTLPLVADDATRGVVGLFVSGALGLLAFAAAYRVRIRALDLFGFRRATGRHIIVGAALGVAAYLLGVLAAILYVTATGDLQNVQSSYQAAAGGGWWMLALTLLAGALITPLGEEAFFRGVLANALLARYGAWVAVLVSAAVFALAHGINPVLPVAFVVGVLTAVLFRWSRSVWPGVALHAVNNAVALLVPVVLSLDLG